MTHGFKDDTDTPRHSEGSSEIQKASVQSLNPWVIRDLLYTNYASACSQSLHHYVVGMLSLTCVPLPGADVITSDAFKEAARDCMFFKPLD